MTMNKLTALAALTAGVMAVPALQAQDTAPELSANVTFGWESEYVFRGVKLAEYAFTPAVDISYGGFYAGIWAALPVDTDRSVLPTDGGLGGNEVDIYAGYSFAATDLISVDFGFTYYTYPDAQDDLFDTFDSDEAEGFNSLEPFIGVAFDVMLQPAVYVFYDIHYENLTVEASLGHTFEVAESMGVEVGGFAGMVSLDTELYDDIDDYFYVGASIDFVYTILENVSASIGARASWVSEDLVIEDLDELDSTDLEDITYWFGWAVNAGF